MPNPGLTDDQLATTVAAYRAHAMNVSAAARELGISRSALQNRIRAAYDADLLSEVEMHGTNAPSATDYFNARERKIERFAKKRRKGNWDKPILSRIQPGPFRLKLFGDPHLDSDGCDFELFERHWLEMSVENRVFGVCIGDWFNNWLRVLSHLWKGEGDPDDAWLLFEYLVEARGAALIAACSGNHDDWTHGPVDPVDHLLKRHGVIYRTGAVRVFIDAGGTAPVTCALRHKWKGHSMYSPAHGLRRAAAEGWDDDIMVGGHIHQDEDRHYVQPRSGRISHLFQLSAFKKFDLFPDVHGFKPHAISPVRDLVIDPRRPSTDPERVVKFFSSEAAKAHLEAII